MSISSMMTESVDITHTTSVANDTIGGFIKTIAVRVTGAKAKIDSRSSKLRFEDEQLDKEITHTIYLTQEVFAGEFVVFGSVTYSILVVERYGDFNGPDLHYKAHCKVKS
jgi:hypothetical protein